VSDPKTLPAPLTERDVHIWIVPLAVDAFGEEAPSDVLSAHEQAVAARYASPEDRRRHVLSHAAVRRILAVYIGREAGDIRFAVGPHGKPRVVGSDIEYSLAHAGRLGLVGVGRRHPLGVDVEPVRLLPLADELKRACFTPSEREHLDAVGSADELLRLWVRKEAALKATGEGLSRSLDSVDVLTGSGLPGWKLRDLVPARGYVAAAAVRAEVGTVLVQGLFGEAPHRPVA
jgi:4'-phosphopantetheinyl transferase